jgi:hypothetical protein
VFATTKQTIENKMADYNQTNSPAFMMPGAQEGNPYLGDKPAPEHEEVPQNLTQIPEAVEEADISTRIHWQVKSVNPLKRIF